MCVFIYTICIESQIYLQNNASAILFIFQEHPLPNDKLLTLDGFLSHVKEQIRVDVKAVWKALFACGYDLQLERFIIS